MRRIYPVGDARLRQYEATSLDDAKRFPSLFKSCVVAFAMVYCVLAGVRDETILGILNDSGAPFSVIVGRASVLSEKILLQVCLPVPPSHGPR
jgi:hypothetical protein